MLNWHAQNTIIKEQYILEQITYRHKTDYNFPMSIDLSQPRESYLINGDQTTPK